MPVRFDGEMPLSGCPWLEEILSISLVHSFTLISAFPPLGSQEPTPKCKFDVTSSFYALMHHGNDWGVTDITGNYRLTGQSMEL